MAPGSNDPVGEVIGIAADVRTSTLEKQGSVIAYVPYWRRAPTPVTIVMRTTGDPAAMTTAARGVLRRVDPAAAVAKVRTMDQIVAAAVAPRRFQVSLLVMFAIMALLTASIGIYGVIAQSLVSRMGEIGVRMALGAPPARVQQLVMGEGMRPVALGLGVGIIASIALGRGIETLLFEVRPSDLATLIGVTVILASVAVVACAIPARRATRTDLVAMLRSE
jgi:putative ABC transport system permease protein